MLPRLAGGPLLALALSACIVEAPRGPELGKCAKVPEGVYQYGDAGIGTCLAGPADLRFFQQRGGTFLAVTNADPFQEFRAGSVLVLDWDDVSLRLGSGDDRIPVDEVTAYAVEIADDDDGDGEGGNAFLGGFGYVPSAELAIVTSRLTEGAVVRAGRDEAWTLDLTRMEDAQGITRLGQVRLEDDPFPVLVDAATDRVFVGNLTDHSLSVLTSEVDRGEAPAGVAEIDVAPGAGATDADLSDRDGSGTFAELTRLAVLDPELVVEDRWTYTFVDATERLYVPTPDDDDSGTVGLVRWSSGDTLTYSASAFGLETGLGGHVEDPFVEMTAQGIPVLWFARDGDIHRALTASIEAGEWALDATDPVLASDDEHGSPSVVPLAGEIGLYTDLPDGTIHLSVSPDGVAFTPEGPVLVAPAGTIFEDPFAVLDPAVGRFRMWLTVRDGAGSSVAIAESDDGRTWTDPEVVLAPAGLDVASPAVAALDGRYAMWTTVADPAATGWDHAFSWSWDGRSWTDPVVVVEGQLADDVPPGRVGVQVDAIGAWRVEGVDQGALPSLLPAGVGTPTEIFGYEVSVASGHEVGNGVVSGRRADQGLVPGSFVATPAGDLLYATAIGSGSRERVVVLERGAASWVTAVAPDEMDDLLGVGPAETASSPVVVEDDGVLVMFVTITSPDGPRLLRSTSSDGVEWSEAGDAVFAGEDPSWDSAGQFAHSIERLGDGRVRLWYEGSDGSRTRIGSALADDPRARFVREEGAGTEWRLGTGSPGSFDDSAVADPLAVRIDDRTHLYYSGFDGVTWHLGHAVVEDDGSITRRTDPATSLSIAAMNGVPRTFSGFGVAAPVLAGGAGDRIELFYAGSDGDAWRLGRAAIDADAPDMAFAEQRFPTAGDTLTFETERGGAGAQVIELEQSTQWYVTTGEGMVQLTHDEDRGFVYVTTKVDDQVYVVDIRDDSDGTFQDVNVLDLEGLIRVDTGSANAGFRDAVVSRTRGLLYLTQLNPDGLAIVDLTRVPDDDTKAPFDAAVVAILPLQDLDDDAGADTFATIGGAGMALTADERLLLVSHFRGNGVSVFDLEQGAWGQEVAWIANVGENPHVVRISPDGRWAAVANYLGDVEGNTVSSTLAFVDLDPASDRYLEVAHWLVNVP